VEPRASPGNVDFPEPVVVGDREWIEKPPHAAKPVEGACVRLPDVLDAGYRVDARAAEVLLQKADDGRMLEPDRRIGGRWIDHAVVPDQVDHDQRQGNSRQGSATKPAIAVG